MNSQNHPILKLDHICFSIKSGFWMKSQPILHDICIELKQGKVLGLIGHNGAGKTTTLNIAAGLVLPNKGCATFNGSSVLQVNVRRKIGYLGEIQYPFKHLKIDEWFRMLGSLSGIQKGELKRRIKLIMAVFELENLKNKFLNQLSKGQLQRVNFAQALIHGPEILILDEPMSGLDAYWRYQALSFLKLYKENGGSIIFSSHVLTDVKDIADDIACIDKGRIQWCYRADQIEDYLGNKPKNKNFNRVLF